MENNKLKGLFRSNERTVLCLYTKLRKVHKRKLGRGFSIGLIEQITITLFKMRYDLPYRVMEILFGYDHVTLSRVVLRMGKMLSALRFSFTSAEFVVDSTTVKIGKGKTDKTFSGYKHYHGVKFQAVVDEGKRFVCVSDDHDSSVHDKELFLREYGNIVDRVLGRNIVGDKAYVGLEGYNVITPSKRNEVRYKEDRERARIVNRGISRRRIKIEHCFARLKSYRVLTKPSYWSRRKIALFVRAIANVINSQIESK